MIRMQSDRGWMTVSEVGSELRVDPATVRRWIKDEQLSAVRFGPKNLRVHRDELDAFIHASRVGSVSA